MLDLRREYEYMKRDIDLSLEKCLGHQKWILGPEIEELENKLAAYLGVKHCVGVSSGTEALVISLRALAIKMKDEEYFSKEEVIITTPFTFTATGDAILRSGATPVFVDIDMATYNIDVNKIKGCLNSTSNVIGIIPVHLYGMACRMDKIMSMAKEHNLFVLEDVAQAFGGMWNGQKLGAIGTVGAFSFFPSKNLGCFGDGGMIATNDDKIAEIGRMLLKHGGKDKYDVMHIGYNARLDTIQAAVLLAKLKYVDEFNVHRNKIAEIYNEELKGMEGLSLPVFDVKCVYHQYTVRTSRRKDLQTYLKEKGISTMIYYPVPLHRQRLFHKNSQILKNLDRSEIASSEVLSLPIGPCQTEEDTMYVASVIKDFFKV